MQILIGGTGTCYQNRGLSICQNDEYLVDKGVCHATPTTEDETIYIESVLDTDIQIGDMDDD